MNAGAAIARGNVLLFLHADTRLPGGAVELIRAGLNYGHRAWGRFDVRIDSRNPVLWVVARMMNLRSRWTGIATGDQAIFVRRTDFERIGGFPDVPLMEDIALSRALRRLSPPAYISMPVITSARRWQRHGVLRTILLMWRLRFAYSRGADPADLAISYGYARHDE
jgi:rSAM/selenodomain-associated transferase 2